jgi:hypothetical protein
MEKMFEATGSLCLELKKDTVYPAKRDIAKEMKLGYMKLLSEFKLT